MPELVDDVLELLAPFPSANALAREIGFDSAQSASTAANLAVPLIVAGMVHQLNDADRSAALIEMVRTVDTESLGDFGLALTERRYEPVGSETIKQILGPKHRQIAARLAPQAECVEQSAAEVFPPMAWVVTGLIAKRNGNEQNRHSLLQIVRNEHDGLLRTGWGEWMSAVSPDEIEPEKCPADIAALESQSDGGAEDEIVDEVEPESSAESEIADESEPDSSTDGEVADEVEPDDSSADGEVVDEVEPDDSTDDGEVADEVEPDDSSADGDIAEDIELAPTDDATDTDDERGESPGRAQALAPAWWREKNLSAAPGGASTTPVGPTPDQPLEQTAPQVSADLGHAVAVAETGDENAKQQTAQNRNLWPAAAIAAFLVGAAGVWFLTADGRDSGTAGSAADIVSFDVTLTDQSDQATVAATALLQFDQAGQQLCFNTDMNGRGSSLDGVVERAAAGSATDVLDMGLVTDSVIGCMTVEASTIEAILADPASHRLALSEPDGAETMQGPLSG